MTTLVSTLSVRALGRRAMLRGLASLFDLRGNTLRQYRIYSSAAEVDARSLADDWHTVGRDLTGAALTVTSQR